MIDEDKVAAVQDESESTTFDEDAFGAAHKYHSEYKLSNHDDFDTDNDEGKYFLCSKVIFNRLKLLFIVFFVGFALLGIYHINTASSLRDDIEYYENRVEEQIESAYNASSFGVSVLNNLSDSYKAAKELLSQGKITQSIFDEMFPLSESEYINGIKETISISANIDDIIEAYKNRSDESSLYEYYRDKEITLTAYIKSWTYKDGYETYTLRVDNRDMTSFFGTTIEFKEPLTDEVTSFFANMHKGDKIVLTGIGDTSGITFRLYDCVINSVETME